jgi:hypothetical protein
MAPGMTRSPGGGRRALQERRPAPERAGELPAAPCCGVPSAGVIVSQGTGPDRWPGSSLVTNSVSVHRLWIALDRADVDSFSSEACGSAG